MLTKDLPMTNTSTTASPFNVPNVRMFIAFRIFFNARFYYPVFTILFLDFGLTMAQFALLNAIWAATIVMAEVPSGALADVLGRRKLIVGAGVIMVVEIALLCFVPRGNPGLLFTVFAVNRVLSGLAEASASGADEAIAYDALKEAGLHTHWNRVIEMQMRLQSMAYIAAMTLGAAVYDPVFMQAAADGLGVDIVFTRAVTLRLPLYMTLAMAVLALFAAYQLKETGAGRDPSACGPLEGCGVSIREAFAMTLRAGRWILATPFALVIIFAGFLFDSTVRMVITLSSQYYRVIQVPEALFGLIGGGIAVLGLIIPRLALRMSTSRTPRFNLLVVAAITLAGLAGMALFIPRTGLVPAVVLFSAMYLTGFFVSHYLNHITDSVQRATVLSFKGLSYNLAYGMIGLLYSLLVARTRPEVVAQFPVADSQLIENLVFKNTFIWFPGAFVIGLAIFFWFAARRLEGTDQYRRTTLDSGKELS